MNTLKTFVGIAAVAAILGPVTADARAPGLNAQAAKELRAVGMDRYVGRFKPKGEPEAMGSWNRYSYDTEGGDGPICIDGSEFTVFHQQKAAKDLLIVLDGGGACVQDSYRCSLEADQTPPGASGIFADRSAIANVDNPFADYSKVFVSYCDGSVFTGDNTLQDANFPGGVRHHRGIRNLTAALDLARDLHPNAKRVLLSGISAGGYGVSAFAPSVFRFVFPAAADLFVLNDSGPSLSNPLAGSVLQDNDWQFAQFYPESCDGCSVLPFSDQGAFIRWTLENDNGYTGALYSTDGDAVIRSFTFLPTQADYRNLLLSVHSPIHDAYPNRYKLFVRSGSTDHTALSFFGFYLFTADGKPLYEWANDLVEGNPGWVNIVEDFVPAP